MTDVVFYNIRQSTASSSSSLSPSCSLVRIYDDDEAVEHSLIDTKLKMQVEKQQLPTVTSSILCLTEY